MLTRSSFSLAVIIASVHFLSCGSHIEKPSEPETRNADDAAGAAGQRPDSTPADARGMSATLACYSVDAAPKAVLKSQTFAINFEPFKNSCFVTSHDPEFTDPALDAELAIYKDGKKEKAFHGDFPVTMGDPVEGEAGLSLPPGCWVEAVAFQDINADRMTDVLVVAKCGGKSGSYNENMVLINNGKFLTSRRDANYAIADLKTIKQIVEYSKNNPEPFSLIVDAANSNSKP